MKRVQQNKGFTLVELLISMALLSIIMLMVVQFMSTTTAANKRAKYNMKAQTAGSELITNMSETISMASYVQVIPYEADVYEKPEGTRLEPMSTCLLRPTSDTTGFTFNLVTDDYGNFVRNTNLCPLERKVIVDMQTYQLLGEKKDTVYPLSGDLDSSGADVRSFRSMKQVSKSGDVSYLYVKPKYIYVENSVRESNPLGVLKEKLYYTMYRFDYSDPDKTKVYVYRDDTIHNLANKVVTAKNKVDALSGEDGLLTDDLKDFYLSCDAEGGAFMLDALMDVKGYMYNACETVALRNTEVLTARPYRSYRLGEGGDDADSGWTTPEDELNPDEDEPDSGESGSGESSEE